MLAQICQFLAVDSSNFPVNEHIIIGDRSCEGGFLIHYFLNLCQRQKRPVCFVGLSQSFNHYNSVAQKLGTNLLSARDENKNLVFIEGLQLLTECVTYSDKQRESNPFYYLVKGDIAPFEELIRKSIDTLAQAANSESQFHVPVIIIDDLSILLSAGIVSQDIVRVVKSLQDIVTSGTRGGSLVISSHLERSDEEAEEAWAFLSHVCSLKIDVSDLKSGYCKDVHGQMQIEWRDTDLKPRRNTSKQTQFKLSDRSIELFASGLSAAVL